MTGFLRQIRVRRGIWTGTGRGLHLEQGLLPVEDPGRNEGHEPGQPYGHAEGDQVFRPAELLAEELAERQAHVHHGNIGQEGHLVHARGHGEDPEEDHHEHARHDGAAGLDGVPGLDPQKDEVRKEEAQRHHDQEGEPRVMGLAMAAMACMARTGRPRAPASEAASLLTETPMLSRLISAAITPMEKT